MAKYGIENWERFQRSGVTPEDIKAMKVETVREAFADTKADFKHLVEQLAKGIKEGRWTAMLGDDVSGRHVANVIGRLATRYASEYGQKAPERIFFAGGGLYDAFPDEESQKGRTGKELMEEKQRNLKKYIQEQAQRLGDHVLLVTEHIMGGRTVHQIGQILEQQGIKYDVATLWTGGELEDLKSPENNWYTGKEKAGASGPFGSEVSNVLYKLGVPLNEAAGIKKHDTDAVAKRDDSADRELVSVAREETTRLTDELYAEYFSEK